MARQRRLPATEVNVPESSGAFVLRVYNLFGHRDTRLLQVAFARGHSQIEAWLYGTRPVPRDVLMVLDLLGACPKSRWPARWKEIL